MNLSPDGEFLIQRFEALRLEAYLDQAGIPTIGFGTIRYPNGQKVKMGDTCTVEQAVEFFRHDTAHMVSSVDALTTDAIAPHQFDALVSLAYNIGDGAYRDSTVRKRVNSNPADPTIRDAFMMWSKIRVKGKLKRSKGLWRRRHLEADYYFGVQTPEPPMP